MMVERRESLKNILGEIPYAADFYWYLRRRGQANASRFNLDRLREALPEWIAQANLETAHPEPTGKHIAIFGMLNHWISHTALLSVALRALGHKVSLTFLPYARWKQTINKFDLRQQELLIQETLRSAAKYLDVQSILALQPVQLPEKLKDLVEGRAYRDTQYTELLEEIDVDSQLYELRKSRNVDAASRMYRWLTNHQPDVVVIPNGSILEFGVMFEVARFLDIRTITYEFGEQNDRIWMAQDGDAMAQDTGDLWNQRGDIPLTEEEQTRIRALFEARQGADIWENFSRQWQGEPPQGGQAVRSKLGLDDRPLVLIPTNVLGDSLTLGRQIITPTMTDWLRRTIEIFNEKPDFQLVIRVHPGEAGSWGPSVYDILRESYPSLPENVHLLPADADVNTYDLVDAADIGLVYTTTVGLEMVMSGRPVIVTGKTHYRSRGFTYDPGTWDEFVTILEDVLRDPAAHRPTEEQVRLAWRYAYRFFFEYPQPFPWRIPYLWESLEKWPVEKVMSPEGQGRYGDTFRYLAGEPIEWGREAGDK